MFKRKIYDKLLEWKRESNGRTALLIEGARRIGKSTVAEEFGSKRSTIDYEMNSLLAVSSLYGVDILADNVAACRERLYKLWAKQYKSVCKSEC